MNVAVVGSRDFPYPLWVEGFVRTLNVSDVLVSGGGGVVDLTAERVARQRGMNCKIYPANWKTHGRAAGPLRNTMIVDTSDWVVAFWDGKSNGTKDTVTKAQARRIPVLIVYPDGTMMGKRPSNDPPNP